MDIQSLLSQLQAGDPMTTGRLMSGDPSLMGQLQPSPMMASPLGPGGAGPQPDMPMTGQAPPSPQNPMAPQMPTQSPPPMTMAGTPPAKSPSLYERIMSGLFHTPSALQGVVSPEDQQAARSQALLQMGARMMGAGLPPGSHSHFGMNLASSLAGAQPAYNQGIEGALQAHSGALGLLGQQYSVGRLGMQMRALQGLSQMDTPDPSDHKGMMDWHMQRGTILNAAGDTAGAQAEFRAANVDRLATSGGLGTHVAPPEWFDTYKAAHPEPAPGTADHVQYMHDMANAVTQAGFTGSAIPIRGIADSEQRAQQFARSAGQRDTALGQSQNRLTDAENNAFGKDPAANVLVKSAPNYARAESLISEARTNPAATGSAVINVIQALDPKAQVRSQIIDYMSNFDKSITGTLAQKMAKWQTGTYPPAVLDNVEHMLLRQKQTDMNSYERLYQQAHKANPSAPIRTTMELYGGQGATGGNPAANALGVTP